MEDISKKRRRSTKVKNPEEREEIIESIQIEEEIMSMPEIVFEDAGIYSGKKLIEEKSGSNRVGTSISNKWRYFLVALLAYIVWKYIGGYTASPEELAKLEMQTVVESVGRLIELPQGEEPTIATVSNLEALKGQPFFANAKIGDRVLIYSNSGKAILYRTETNKLIEVAPFSFNNAPADEQKSN